MERIPASPARIDATWLTAALAERHPGVRVASIELLEVHEATNAHARLRVAYDEPAGCPEFLFCKLLPTEPERRRAIVATRMGIREARFYERLAPLVGMRVPRIHAVRVDETDGGFVLLMEDLVSTGCRVSDGPTGVSPDAAAAALEDLAELHTRFASAEHRAAQAPWVQPADPPSDYGSSRLRYALDHHRDRLSAPFAELASLYVEKRDAVHAVWDEGPRTIVHGDVHVGNLFDDAGRTGFLDWGILHVGTPLRDASYFLTMALGIEDRRAHERELLRHYVDRWVAGGGDAISQDDAWRAHRLHAAYTVPASCQIVTFPDGISERRRIFSEAFLARAEAAVEDLEARAALRDYAGL